MDQWRCRWRRLRNDFAYRIYQDLKKSITILTELEFLRPFINKNPRRSKTSSAGNAVRESITILVTTTTSSQETYQNQYNKQSLQNGEVGNDFRSIAPRANFYRDTFADHQEDSTIIIIDDSDNE